MQFSDCIDIVTAFVHVPISGGGGELLPPPPPPPKKWKGKRAKRREKLKEREGGKHVAMFLVLGYT